MANETLPSDNPFAPPSAQVRDVPETTGDFTLASRGARLAAVIIDGLAFALIGGGYALIFGILNPSAFMEGGMVLAGFGVIMLGLVVVNLYLIAARGQTVGKLLMKIRIVRPTGQKAGFWRIFGLRIFVNGLISAIPFVGPVYWLVDSLLIFRDSHQCAHDQLADTPVIKA